MRLWVKLAVIVGVAVGAQWWADRNAAAIDEAMLTVQCVDQAIRDENRYTEAMVAAADRMREREMGREMTAVAAAR